MIYCIYSVYIYIVLLLLLLLLFLLLLLYIVYTFKYCIYIIYIHRCIFIQYITIHTYTKYCLYFHVYSNPYCMSFYFNLQAGPPPPSSSSSSSLCIVHRHPPPNPNHLIHSTKVNHESPSTIMWLENSDYIAS